MFLWLILALALGLGIVWRLVRLAVRLGLLLALIAVYGARSSHSHSTTAPPSSASARVARVADGDTLTAITARAPVRVRLLGIDAPELTDTRFGYPTCGGRAGRDPPASARPPRTRVPLITDPESGDTRDAHHRFAGLRRRPARRPRAQLAAGEAIVYRYHDPRFSRLGAYERAELVTRAHDRGHLARMPWRLAPAGALTARSEQGSAR